MVLAKTIDAMDSFITDLRYGFRLLLKNPGISALIIFVLAIGIGANSAVFTVANALLLNPLPFENVERLVCLRESFAAQSQKSVTVSPADFIDWRDQNRSFPKVAAYRIRDLTLISNGEPELLRGSFVSIDFFSALMIRPVMGRSFLPDEMEPGRDLAAVLSHGFWQSRLASDPNILGKSIVLNGRRTTIIGIMPPHLDFPFGTQIWLPLALTSPEKTQRDVRNLYVFARLKQGVSVQESREEMSAIAERLQRLYPKTNTGLRTDVIPMRNLQAEFTKPMLTILLSMAVFLLLIACANVANLLLARGTMRAKEIAIRSALSASRWRLIRQFVTESILLSFIGGILGLTFSFWTVELVKSSLPADIARFIAGWSRIGIDRHVLAFNFTIAFLTTFIFSLLPAFQGSRTNISDALKEGSSFATSSRGTRRARTILVASELALALVLLTGAGLMAIGFWRILNLYQRNDPQRVLTLQTQLPEAAYQEPERVTQFYEQVLQRMEGLHSVKSTSLASNTPLNNSPNPVMEFVIEGQPALLPGERRLTDIVIVSPGYFDMIGARMLRGRDFHPNDGSNAPAVAVISDLMARRFWPKEDPIGKRIRRATADQSTQWITIVGIVADVKQSWFDKEIRPQLYLSYLQFPRYKMTFLLRAASDPMALVPAARAQVFAVDRNQPITEIKTLGQVYVDEGSPFRFAAVLILVFGAISLALSVVGVYAVISYNVAQRKREIGIRNALGAQKLHILLLVLRQGIIIAVVGIGAGLLLSMGLSRVLETILFGVVQKEPSILISGIALFLLIVFAACYFPARRAARLDPALILRSE